MVAVTPSFASRSAVRRRPGGRARAFALGGILLAGWAGCCCLAIAGEALPGYDEEGAPPLLPIPPSTAPSPTGTAPLAAPVLPGAGVGAATADAPGVPSMPFPPSTATATSMPTPPAPVQGLGVAGEEPRRGRVKAGAGRVNVRAGPGEEFEIIEPLASGTPLTVYARATAGNGDIWYKVNYPEGRTVGVRAADVTWNPPFEIPGTGVPGAINKDEVDLFVRAWDKGTVVGKATKDMPVVVKSTRDLWLNILAPATARAYIHGDYVDVQGAPPPADAQPAVNPELTATAGQGAAGGPARRRDNLTARQRQAFEAYNQNIANLLEAEERAREEEYKRILEDWSRRRTAVDDLDMEIRRIEAESLAKRSGGWVETGAGKLPHVYDPAETGFTGWVEYIGRLGNRPAAFRLVKGGETVFLLRSAQFKLEEYNFKRVWINGFSEPTPGAEANVFIVTDLRVLGEPPDSLKNATVRFTHPDTAPVPSTPGQYTGTASVGGPVEVIQYGPVSTPVDSGSYALPEVIGQPAPVDTGLVPMPASGFGPTTSRDIPAASVGTDPAFTTGAGIYPEPIPGRITTTTTTTTVTRPPVFVTPGVVVETGTIPPGGALPDVIGRPVTTTTPAVPGAPVPAGGVDGPVVVVR